MCPKSKIFPPKLKPCFHLLPNVHPCRMTSAVRILFHCAHQAWGIILSLQKIGVKFHKVGVLLVRHTLQLVYHTIDTYNHKICCCPSHYGTTVRMPDC